MIPKEVEVTIKIHAHAATTARMWPTVLPPQRIVGLAIVASVWVYARIDEEIQPLYDLANVGRGEVLVTISQARAELICFKEVSGERDKSIGWNPLPGVDAAQDQHAIGLRACPYPKDMTLA